MGKVQCANHGTILQDLFSLCHTSNYTIASAVICRGNYGGDDCSAVTVGCVHSRNGTRKVEPRMLRCRLPDEVATESMAAAVHR